LTRCFGRELSSLALQYYDPRLARGDLGEHGFWCAGVGDRTVEVSQLVARLLQLGLDFAWPVGVRPPTLGERALNHVGNCVGR
jgi:hypothetical protein